MGINLRGVSLDVIPAKAGIHKRKLKTKNNKGFTSKYDITKLVYTEEFTDIKEALTREKNLKKWKRSWKIELIEKTNPEWKDLIE